MVMGLRVERWAQPWNVPQGDPQVPTLAAASSSNESCVRIRAGLEAAGVILALRPGECGFFRHGFAKRKGGEVHPADLPGVRALASGMARLTGTGFDAMRAKGTSAR